MKKNGIVLAAAGAVVLGIGTTAPGQSMVKGENGYSAKAIWTIGQTLSGYTPPGILDGMGAFQLDENTYRVYCNHELLNFDGYPYEVSDGAGGTYTMTGARVSYFDIDKTTREVVDTGRAYNLIYDQLGNVATSPSFLSNDFAGFSRFCSASLYEPHQFGEGRGYEDRVFVTSEEDGGFFNSVGANIWVLDTATGEFWGAPDLGRGAWENSTVLDTGRADTIAILLCDDNSPFDFNPDANDGVEAAPLYLYVGQKDPSGDFLARQGLRGGDLYAWVSDTGETLPSQFNGNGTTLSGSWVQLDNTPSGPPSEDGSTGYDEYGYPVQGRLWIEAKSKGAFGFSRPEDVATNPADGTQAVFASTGVDTYDVDPVSGNGADTFGTTYLVDVDFTDLANLTADITVVYDGDEDVANRALRSPDNLDWADDGFVYIQEDRAEFDTLSGDEQLFGGPATNQNEASIVRLDVATGAIIRLGQIERSVVLDASIPNPEDAVDVDAGSVGAWESSGIIDVAELFGETPGEFFLINVQAHGIDDQEGFNPDSRITDEDLKEGGQLLFLVFCPSDLDGDAQVGFGDLVSVLAFWGPCPDGCAGDLNGDGVVDIADLNLILADFGPCL